MSAHASPSLPPRIVFFDGVCAFCHGVVELLLRLDRHQHFSYASLQGETAERLRAADPSFPKDMGSFVFYENGQSYLRSEAVFEIARHLDWPWRLVRIFRIVPRPLTDLAYRMVAAVRYRIFGKYAQCRLPTTEQRQLLLP